MTGRVNGDECALTKSEWSAFAWWHSYQVLQIGLLCSLCQPPFVVLLTMYHWRSVGMNSRQHSSIHLQGSRRSREFEHLGQLKQVRSKRLGKPRELLGWLLVLHSTRQLVWLTVRQARQMRPQVLEWPLGRCLLERLRRHHPVTRPLNCLGMLRGSSLSQNHLMPLPGSFRRDHRTLSSHPACRLNFRGLGKGDLSSPRWRNHCQR